MTSASKRECELLTPRLTFNVLNACRYMPTRRAVFF
jgi:hypothetical protein